MFAFCDTSKQSGWPGATGTVKPDIGLYTIRIENQGNTMDFHKLIKDHGDETFSYVSYMCLVHLFIEVKKEAD